MDSRVFRKALAEKGLTMELIAENLDVIAPIIQKLAETWDSGEKAGVANQVSWDGWRYSKPQIENPFKSTP